ncbi:hypothetical protein VTK73DRAFT_6085 [Phialemonium thermophilum]|uniref:Uncharacterized protein n=1 Tax=Phialemonium thermophilum TaxID=223376 RepID=A0ABR3V1B9_9PEZI
MRPFFLSPEFSSTITPSRHRGGTGNEEEPDFLTLSAVVGFVLLWYFSEPMSSCLAGSHASPTARDPAPTCTKGGLKALHDVLCVELEFLGLDRFNDKTGRNPQLRNSSDSDEEEHCNKSKYNLAPRIPPQHPSTQPCTLRQLGAKWWRSDPGCKTASPNGGDVRIPSSTSVQAGHPAVTCGFSIPPYHVSATP